MKKGKSPPVTEDLTVKPFEGKWSPVKPGRTLEGSTGEPFVFGNPRKVVAPTYLKRPKPRTLPAQCVEANKQHGNTTRDEIIKQWHASQLPPKNRAAVIAAHLNLSRQWVGKVLKKAGLK